MCHKKEDTLRSEGAREGKWAEDGRGSSLGRECGARVSTSING